LPLSAQAYFCDTESPLRSRSAPAPSPPAPRFAPNQAFFLDFPLTAPLTPFPARSAPFPIRSALTCTVRDVYVDIFQ